MKPIVAVLIRSCCPGLLPAGVKLYPITQQPNLIYYCKTTTMYVSCLRWPFDLLYPSTSAGLGGHFTGVLYSCVRRFGSSDKKNSKIEEARIQGFSNFPMRNLAASLPKISNRVNCQNSLNLPPVRVLVAHLLSLITIPFQ